MTKEIEVFKSGEDLKTLLATSYMKQVTNFFGDDKRAMRFLSGVMAATQRNPRLLECTPTSVINSFITMAQLQLMPSDVSGEAYVIPYDNSKMINGKWEKVKEAQFQLGYKGLVTLFYRAGIKEIVAEIVRSKDEFSYENGVVLHRQNPFSDDRGDAVGAYVIVTLPSGGRITKVMSKKEILDIAEKFSKSYKPKDGKKKSPWDEASDPQLWMWRKTVLKQAAKLVPKSDEILEAIEQDNRDSNINEPRPTFNIEECETKLRAAKTEEELARVWSLLPGDAKLQLKEVKDEVKEGLAVDAHIEETPATEDKDDDTEETPAVEADNKPV